MHIVFGYGSLIKRTSCEASCPVGDLSVARIHGWRRSWNVFSDSQCYLGVVPAQGSWLTGVLFSVDSAGLAALDDRESGYDRVLVPRSQVRGSVPSTVPGVWLYVPRDEITVPRENSAASPGYVRVVFDGCEEMGLSWEEFCDSTDYWEYCSEVDGIPTPVRNLAR